VRLIASDGRVLVLSGNLANIRRLMGLIEEQTLGRLLSEALEVYLVEGVCRFGQIWMDWQGVHARNTTISWDANPIVKSGRFFVDVFDGSGKRRLRSLVDEVPNVHVLVALVANLTARMNA
jgi:hypothetical protein